MQYKAYSALHELTVDCCMPVCFNTQVVMNDEESYSDPSPKLQPDDASVEGAIHQHGSDHNQEVFDFKDQPGTSTMDQSEQEIKPTTELLQIHQSLNHLPFKVIQLMAANGHYPKRLVDCRIPKCAACLFGKSTRQPWRTKSQPTGASKLCTFPGQCVSVDQLESLTPGLIAQMKGIPTTKRYMAATVFIDHFSRLSFVHLQSTLSSEDTRQAKKAFERYSESHGVKIMHYHADNGRFVDHAFIQDIKSQNQRVTYCGINAHFQNGVAEKRIRDLQDLTHTTMLHASARWPKAFSDHLWPYALRCVNETFISAPKRLDGKSALQIFSGTSVLPKANTFRPFGCPVYILDNRLQAGFKISKWHTRARVGLYLRHSPMHAKTVSLVLNISTGLVSPQFHIKFNDFFETVNTPDDNFKIEWKEKCHFVKTLPQSTGTMQVSEGVLITPKNDDLTNSKIGTPPSGDPLPQIPSVLQHEEGDVSDTKEVTTVNRDNINLAEQDSVKCSKRHKPSIQLQESLVQRNLVFSSIFDDIDGDEEIRQQVQMLDPIAYSASSDPDTMYMDQAMKQPDRK